MNFPNTLKFFRDHMEAASCIDPATQERVLHCVANNAVETLGNGTDMGDIETFLVYGPGFPFRLSYYESVKYDEQCRSTANAVRSLLQAFRKDRIGRNFTELDEGPSISWTARTAHYSFYVNDGKPHFFVNGTIPVDSREITQQFDAALAPMEVFDLMKYCTDD